MNLIFDNFFNKYLACLFSTIFIIALAVFDTGPIHAADSALLSIQDNSWAKISPNPSQRYIPGDMKPSDILEDQNYPAGRSYSGIHYGDGKLFYFGGGHGSYPGNDVEMYDISENIWIQSYKPEVCIGDEGNGCEVLYGGAASDAMTPLGRPYTEHTYQQIAFNPEMNRFFAILGSGTWEFNPITKDWIYLTGEYNPDNSFSPDSNTAREHLIYDENLGTIQAILTASNRGIYTFKNGSWVKESGTVPSDNWELLFSTYVPDLGLHIIKGWGKFWKYNAATQEWTEIIGVPAEALEMIDFDYDIENKALVGLTYNKGGSIAVWAYDVLSDSWHKMPTSNLEPLGGTGGADHSSAANPVFKYSNSFKAFFYLYVPSLGSGFTGGEYTELWAYRYKESGSTGDLLAPTVPGSLTPEPVSSSAIKLSWSASSDNVGVSGYKIYRDGAQIAASSASNYSDANLAASSTYTYSVAAYDNSGNLSAQSNSVAATTHDATVNVPPPPSPQGQAQGALNNFSEGLGGNTQGATRAYYNGAAQLKWKNAMGDWQDSQNTPQGNSAYATADIVDDNNPRIIEWDVTSLVQEWVSGTYPNNGVIIKETSGGGSFIFYSREHSVASQRPKLLITIGGSTTTYYPAADTFLSLSSDYSFGDQTRLEVDGSRRYSLIRWDLDEVAAGAVNQAKIQLYVYELYGGGTTSIGIFRLAQDQDLLALPPQTMGIAEPYSNDNGLDQHSSVFFSTDFESANWKDEWSYVGANADTVISDPDKGFKQLDGKAMRGKIVEGSVDGVNIHYNFEEETGSEPEEIYFRYYLRLANDWNQTVDGGKMPGASGTYGISGWGGSPANGDDGWSARGAYALTLPPGNPLEGKHPIGNYVYHVDQFGSFGDVWLWQKGFLGYLDANKWYCIEQYVKLNTAGDPNGANDGIIRAWVNGRLAFEKTDIRFRDVDTLKIERIWVNVYHGGIVESPYDQHFYFDNFVIAKEYIGPIEALNPGDQTQLAAPTRLRIIN